MIQEAKSGKSPINPTEMMKYLPYLLEVSVSQMLSGHTGTYLYISGPAFVVPSSHHQHDQ